MTLVRSKRGTAAHEAEDGLPVCPARRGTEPGHWTPAEPELYRCMNCEKALRRRREIAEIDAAFKAIKPGDSFRGGSLIHRAVEGEDEPLYACSNDRVRPKRWKEYEPYKRNPERGKKCRKCFPDQDKAKPEDVKVGATWRCDGIEGVVESIDGDRVVVDVGGIKLPMRLEKLRKERG